MTRDAATDLGARVGAAAAGGRPHRQGRGAGRHGRCPGARPPSAERSRSSPCPTAPSPRPQRARCLPPLPALPAGLRAQTPARRPIAPERAARGDGQRHPLAALEAYQRGARPSSTRPTPPAASTGRWSPRSARSRATTAGMPATASTRPAPCARGSSASRSNGSNSTAVIHDTDGGAYRPRPASGTAPSARCSSSPAPGERSAWTPTVTARRTPRTSPTPRRPPLSTCALALATSPSRRPALRRAALQPERVLRPAGHRDRRRLPARRERPARAGPVRRPAQRQPLPPLRRRAARRAPAPRRSDSRGQQALTAAGRSGRPRGRLRRAGSGSDGDGHGRHRPPSPSPTGDLGPGVVGTVTGAVGTVTGPLSGATSARTVTSSSTAGARTTSALDRSRQSTCTILGVLVRVGDAPLARRRHHEPGCHLSGGVCWP